jgi:uncharacterized protein with ParB-like and HNH nuclease domain
MKADAMSLTFLANEGSVTIPFFQRGYVWDKYNWEDILADLLDTTKNNFLGSLILKQQPRQTGKPKDVLVIDGQQRLTTLSILIKALHDTFEGTVKTNCEATVNSFLYYKKNATDSELNVKIKHSRIDSAHYNKIIKDELELDEYNKIIVADNSNKIPENIKYNKVLQCYKYFKEELGKIDFSVRVELFNRLSDTENKILVLIDLSEKDNEQSIFDTINNAGIRLSSADTVKNALFQKAIELIGSLDPVLLLHKEFWENIFSSDEDSINFWDTERLTGRLKRDNIEILLHAIAVIKGFFDPDKNTLSDIPNLFKDYIDQLDKNELIVFIKDIAKYAKIYRNKILSFENSTLFSFDNTPQRLFHILSQCEISTFHPYILSLYFKYDDVTIIPELKKLEKYIIRRLITNQDTKSYNKTCRDFINDSNLINTKSIEISDDLIRASLLTISNKSASLLLFWIELYRRHIDTKQSIKELKYNYSLEHILPQKWEEYWSSVPVFDKNANQILEINEAKKERYSRIYSFGNMTLLNSSLNTSLRNYIFERKIEGEGRKKGIQLYADLSITKIDILSNYDKGDKVWDEKKINDRTNSLAKEVLAIW